MKSLNQRIFEEVLEPMNLVNFLSDGTIKGRGFNCKIYDFENNSADAFWLAEKVGLFDYATLSKSRIGWVIRGVARPAFYGKTIPEVICNAILEIYGKKE